MAIPLLVMLIGTYLVLGLKVRTYNTRTRLMLVGVSLLLPAWFYFFW